MLKIRLMRVGKRHQPSFRIVVTEARSKRDGRYVEKIGFYNPQTEEIEIDQTRWQYWQKCGAQPTKAAQKLYEKIS